MDSIVEKVNQTPIEIALGIDENGKTTARKLYDFLSMDKSNYSRWVKNNITDNQFAEENIDYVRFVFDDETPTGGVFQREDFKLTARFAKKLSMIQKNERGEEAREYFTKVEDYAVKTTIQLQQIQNDPMKLLEMHYRAMQKNSEDISKVRSDVTEVQKELERFKEELPMFGVDEDRITTAVAKRGVDVLGGKRANAYADKSLRGKVYQDIYREIRYQFGIRGTYKQLKRNQCELVVNIIENYRPPLFLAEQIKDCNAQENLSV